MTEDCGWPYCTEACAGNPRCADPDGTLATQAQAEEAVARWSEYYRKPWEARPDAE